ncbi:MAG TPA: ubiquinone/menaquinone biosynthesis methyltransferase [Gemmatimonadales bacterium]|nr:ubiquinone/menaquinone biosynthesis methyltransferase [Gemmatimonadales bacterium]
MFASDRELPVSGGAAKRAYVRQMFTAIAPTYDRLNRIISMRLDLYWRRKSVEQLDWERAPAGRYLDLCAGTLDFAAILSRQPGFRGRIVGADFVQPMLELGRHKSDRVEPVTADALELPFPDAAFDGAVVGWGVRNLADLDAGLREAARVLKPGARLVVLEMSTPPHQPLRGLYLAYFEHVLPRIGRLISKHTTAYDWLPESARVFPEPPELARRMESARFSEVRFTRFLGGVTAMHVGKRKG